MNSFWKDVRYGIRTLRTNKMFSVVAIVVLALGIGANTAIFSVVDGVLLRPLPFPTPDQLVVVRDDLGQAENVGMSVDELRDLQGRSDIFKDISAFFPADANLTGSDRPERIELLVVSPNYFSLLGADAQLGRVFGPQDKMEGFADGVVISNGCWKRLFGSEPNIIGRNIYIDSDRYTIVGVMPAGFHHPGRTLRGEGDVWATAGFAADPFPHPVRSQRILPQAIARLAQGLSLKQAQEKLDAFVAASRTEFPKDYPAEEGWTIKAEPARDLLVANVRTTLLVLLGGVGLVLLITCVNLANLLLAKSTARRREIAIRLALGATRGRLITQLLIESSLLSLLGGAFAILVVTLLRKVLLGVVPPDVPRLSEVGIDFRVLVFVLLLSTVTGFVFGIIPAIQSSRSDLVSDLKEGSMGGGFGAAHNRFRRGLVVTEFALSLVLMIAAGLLLRSFARILEVNPGFEADRVAVARIWLPVPNNPELDPYHTPAKRAAFVKEVLRRVTALPGVRYAAVGSGNGVPLIGPHWSGKFVVEDRPDEDSSSPRAQTTAVSPDYFRVLGTPLVSGRYFSASDDEHAPGVVLIDEALAQRFFPNVDPIGKRLKIGSRGSEAPWLTVVGVVANIKSDGFDQPDIPHLYRSAFQNPGYALAVYLRTDSNPAGFAQTLRREVQAVDANLPVFGEQTLLDLVSASLGQRRFAMQIVGLFGLLGLLLAAIGIYGVMSYVVSQRTREIGIRLALGAHTRVILWWIVKQGLWLSLLGITAGVIASLALTRLLRGLLFGVGPTDLITYIGVAVVLTVVGLVACYIPAWRATKVSPIIALRQQ